MSKNKKSNSDNISKPIIYTAQFLEFISTPLAVKFAKKLFISPIKHKIPKREFEMDKNAKQKLVFIPAIKKEIMVYEYGNSDKIVILVHGWSGRGTQLVKIADKLLELGFSTISFDAPAHGKSPGKTTLMTEFIESILELEKQFGKFEFIIGHSLGGMSTLNSIKKGLDVKKAIIVGSGDSVNDILFDFVNRLKLKSKIAVKMRESFEKEYQIDMESYSAYVAAKNVKVPVLVMHDKQDEDVPYTASENIHKHLENSKLLLTENLGHRKILGDKEVINQIAQFINN